MIRSKMRLDIDPRILDKLDPERIEDIREAVTGIKKHARSYKSSISMWSDINNLKDKVRYLKRSDEPDPSKIYMTLKQVKDKKAQYKNYIKQNKKWSALTSFKNLEQELINLKYA